MLDCKKLNLKIVVTTNLNKNKLKTKYIMMKNETIEKNDILEKEENLMGENEVILETQGMDIILDRENFSVSFDNKIIKILQKKEIETEMLYIEMFFALRDFSKYLSENKINYELKITNSPILIIDIVLLEDLDEEKCEIIKKFYQFLNNN